MSSWAVPAFLLKLLSETGTPTGWLLITEANLHEAKKCSWLVSFSAHGALSAFFQSSRGFQNVFLYKRSLQSYWWCRENCRALHLEGAKSDRVTFAERAWTQRAMLKPIRLPPGLGGCAGEKCPDGLSQDSQFAYYILFQNIPMVEEA